MEVATPSFNVARLLQAPSEQLTCPLLTKRQSGKAAWTICGVLDGFCDAFVFAFSGIFWVSFGYLLVAARSAKPDAIPGHRAHRAHRAGASALVSEPSPLLSRNPHQIRLKASASFKRHGLEILEMAKDYKVKLVSCEHGASTSCAFPHAQNGSARPNKAIRLPVLPYPNPANSANPDASLVCQFCLHLLMPEVVQQRPRGLTARPNGTARHAGKPHRPASNAPSAKRRAPSTGRRRKEKRRRREKEEKKKKKKKMKKKRRISRPAPRASL